MRFAIVGASSNRSKFGNKAVRAYLSQSHEVFPVHLKETKIEGIECVPSVSQLESLDRICVYLPEEAALAVLQEFTKFKGAEVWLNPGADSPTVVKKAQSLGLLTVQACAIVDIGLSPMQFPG